MEATLETAEPVEIAEPVAAEPPEPTEPPEPADPAAEPEISEDDPTEGDNLPLFKQAKGALEKIKAENPALAKKITAALIRDGKIAQSFPDGFEKAAETIQKVAELAYPGSEGQSTEQILTSLGSEVKGWREFDVKISNGDPAVLEEFATAAPEGFQKLIPTALERYAALNPEGYSTLVTQAVVADMQASEIPLQLRLLHTFIPRLPDSPEKQEISAAYDALVQWVNKLGAWAKKPINVIPGKNEPAPNQEAVYQQREMDLTRKEWNQASTGYGDKLIDTETARILGNTKPTDEQKKQIMQKVADELDARLTADRKYGEAMRAFLASKNQEGYKRRLHSEYQKLIPGAVRRAVDDLGLKPTQKPGPKSVAQNPTQKPGPKSVTRTAAPANEPAFEKISGHPRTVQGMPRIDLNATTSEMLMAGKAILVGGKRVRWR